MAANTLAASFFELRPEELPCLGIAEKRGLGQTSLEKLTVEKRTV